ncbi:MAG TPA: hypothetical protein VM554_11790 [Acidisarcina sp.]|nr:hypothetical protein [Acidisarcina sp.]
MLNSRRTLLRGAFAAAAALLILPDKLSALQRSPQPLPSPHAPDQNAPAGMDGPEIIKPEKSPRNPVNQMQIVALVQQLYKLSAELKDEVDHTNLSSTFPLSIVKKAQQIEKLAKQIKERTKG